MNFNGLDNKSSLTNISVNNMNKFLLILLLLPVSVSAAVFSAPNTYQINETQTSPNRIDYSISGGSSEDPIVAFAVGFNQSPLFESYAGVDNFDLGEWGAIALSAFDWDNTFLSTIGNRPLALDFSLGFFQDINATAHEFFGVSWNEFLSFDTSTPDYAAIYLGINQGISSPFLVIDGFFVEGGTTATPTLIQTASGGVSGGPAGQPNTINNINSVPVPAAVWLFASGLLGLLGLRKNHKLVGYP